MLATIMGAFNLLDVFWAFVSVAIVFASYFYFAKKDAAPELLTAAMLYGKVAETNKKARRLKDISIPKRWFSHFYQLGVVVFTVCSVCVVRLYVLGLPPPALMTQAVNFFVPQRTTADYSIPRFSTTDISGHHIVGSVVFLWAFYVQFDSHLRMASLRKNSAGNVVTLKHKIPRGGMFEYVSCPHYMAEIALYCALTIVLGAPNTTWWLMMSWNFTNQVAVSFLSHNWYLENFPTYPRSRKALIPFVL